MCSVIHDVSSVYPVFIPNMLLWVIFTIMCLIYLISWALNYCIWHKIMMIIAIMQLISFLLLAHSAVLTVGIGAFTIVLIFYIISHVKNNTRKLITSNRK